MSFHQARVSENFSARPIGNDFPLREHDRSRAELESHLEVMSGDQLCTRKTAEDLHQSAPAARIEVRGGFVEHEHRGLACKHTGQASPFSLAKTEVMRWPLGLINKLHALEAIQCDPSRLCACHSEVQGTEGDIFDHGGTEELVVGILKQQSDATANLVCVSRVRFESVDPDARGWCATTAAIVLDSAVGMGDHPAPLSRQERI
jgi:hypothetical protein